MATITHRYDLPDFAAFMNMGFEFKLPDEVLKSVSDLAELVGAPTYVKTPVFPVRSGGGGGIGQSVGSTHEYHVAGSSANSFQFKSGGIALSGITGTGTGTGGGVGGSYDSKDFSFLRQNTGIGGGNGMKSYSSSSSSRSQQIPNSEWENILAFQKTELQKKEGIEARIDNIRSSLNKLTDKTYSTMFENILTELVEIFKTTGYTDGGAGAGAGAGAASDASDELNAIAVMNRVALSIFNTASSNSFYSAIYARLFKDLMGKYEVFREIFEANLGGFLALFDSIEYCDPKKNYDKFCDINKANEKRKAMSLFIVNLMKNGIVEKSHILTILKQLQELLYSNIRQEGKTNEVDEISENLYIIVKNSHMDLKDAAKDADTDCAEMFARRVDQITEISKMKIKTKPSITNKTIFKHLDMLDEISGKAKK